MTENAAKVLEMKLHCNHFSLLDKMAKQPLSLSIVLQRLTKARISSY